MRIGLEQGTTQWNAFSKIDFFTTFEDYTTTPPKLYLGIIKSDDWLDRLSFRAFYAKRNVPNIKNPEFIENLFRLDNESELAIRIGYETDWGFDVTALYEHQFKRVEDTEARFEPIKQFSVKVGISPKF